MKKYMLPPILRDDIVIVIFSCSKYMTSAKMKCKLCEKESDDNFGLFCGRCDKVVFDAFVADIE